MIFLMVNRQELQVVLVLVYVLMDVVFVYLLLWIVFWMCLVVIFEYEYMMVFVGSLLFGRVMLFLGIRQVVGLFLRGVFMRGWSDLYVDVLLIRIFLSRVLVLLERMSFLQMLLIGLVQMMLSVFGVIVMVLLKFVMLMLESLSFVELLNLGKVVLLLSSCVVVILVIVQLGVMSLIVCFLKFVIFLIVRMCLFVVWQWELISIFLDGCIVSCVCWVRVFCGCMLMVKMMMLVVCMLLFWNWSVVIVLDVFGLRCVVCVFVCMLMFFVLMRWCRIVLLVRLSCVDIRWLDDWMMVYVMLSFCRVFVVFRLRRLLLMMVLCSGWLRCFVCCVMNFLIVVMLLSVWQMKQLGSFVLLMVGCIVYEFVVRMSVLQECMVLDIVCIVWCD